MQERNNRQFQGISKTFDISHYLDSPGLSYLNGINGSGIESLRRKTAEISRLKSHLSKPRLVASIGTGQGEELHAISVIYEGSLEKVIGVDVAPLALKVTKELEVANNLPIDLILGSASELPIKDQSIDGIVLSSILHEVYSYSPDGKTAWDKAIQESVRITSENGCIFIRDSASPELEGNIQINMKTDLAKDFYDYFGVEYRAFNGWKNFKGEWKSNVSDFPRRGGSNIMTLSVGQAAELLFHFVNFEFGYPNEQEFIGNLYWKELNEIYYIPDSTLLKPLSTQEYVKEVLAQGNQALRGTEFQLICVESGHSVRPRMSRPINEHFILAQEGVLSITSGQSSELVEHFIKKMDLVFKKVRRNA